MLPGGWISMPVELVHRLFVIGVSLVGVTRREDTGEEGGTPSMTMDARTTARLLTLGAAAGPWYLAVGLAQVLTREGFDVRRHALSQLSNGDLGLDPDRQLPDQWGAGHRRGDRRRRLLRGTRGGTWGPLLLGIYGVGLLGAGIFIADPGRGFPPGAPESTALSRSGLLHFVFGGGGFYALIAACVVFARRFARQGHRFLAIYSIVTAIGFLASFATIASGSTAAIAMLAFYAAVTWIWIWHSVLLLTLRREVIAAVPARPLS